MESYCSPVDVKTQVCKLVILSSDPAISRTHTSIEVYMDLLEAFSGIIAPVFDVHGLPAPPVTIHQQMLEVSGYSSSTGTFKVRHKRKHHDDLIHDTIKS